MTSMNRFLSHKRTKRKKQNKKNNRTSKTRAYVNTKADTGLVSAALNAATTKRPITRHLIFAKDFPVFNKPWHCRPRKERSDWRGEDELECNCG